jgi:3-methyl-2-oxobutanoate hydroxymethyltransferase
MSAQAKIRRKTVTKIRNAKGKAPLVCLTAYSAPIAALADEVSDLILVGDSAGMVVHGFENTVPVTLDMMIMHGQAVVRASQSACIVVDMPFGSYEGSPEVAYHNAARIMQETGCTAIKLEGGAHMAPTIAFLVKRGIPVMAHIGLTPQAVHAMGGYKTSGRYRTEWAEVEADAKAVADAGAFSVVLEGMAEPLAAKITGMINIPTIGIGASAQCDGQILVIDDLLGLTPNVPSFVKKFADLDGVIRQALAAYAAEVKDRSFPDLVHTYALKDQKEAKRA